jgi:hypoxanthine phosphoribosyltransferase
MDLSPNTHTFQGNNLTLYLSGEELSARIRTLAEELNVKFAESATVPVLMPVLSGALRFVAELLPLLDFAYDINCVKVNTYPEGDTATLEPVFQLGFTLDIEARPVIILEDILDTGATLNFLLKELEMARVQSSYLAVLLRKPQSGTYDIQPQWVGFEVPAKFLVGYGLDYSGRMRHLHHIYSLE